MTENDRSAFFTDPEPTTWRKLTLEMIKSDGKRLDITLLRPLSWIEEVKADQGGTIYLDLPEMGAQGDAVTVHGQNMKIGIIRNKLATGQRYHGDNG